MALGDEAAAPQQQQQTTPSAEEPTTSGPGRPSRYNAETIGLLTAFANAPIKEAQAALAAKGVHLDLNQIRRARWYYVNGGREQQTKQYKQRHAVGRPATDAVPKGAFELMREHCNRDVDYVDRLLRSRGYIVDRDMINKQMGRGRERQRVALGQLRPAHGSMAEAVVNAYIEGANGPDAVRVRIHKAGFRPSVSQIYGIKSRYKVYIERARAGESTAPAPAPKRPAALTPPPPPPPAPTTVIEDSRQADKIALRAMILRVGLNVARDAIAEMEHILARTEAKL